MLKDSWKLAVVIGITLTALSLTGSAEKPAKYNSIIHSPLADEIRHGNDVGRQQYSAGRYLEARALFLAAASLSERVGDLRTAAMNWNNAGGSALARRDYRHALADFLRARQVAQASGEFAPLAVTMNNLASLYLQMGNPQAALQIAGDALAGPTGTANPAVRPKLRSQLAGSLARLHRFDEAKGIYRAAADELEDQGDLDSAAIILASLGMASLEANRLDDAEDALSNALLLVRIHHLRSSGNVLRGLAKVKSRRGDLRSAAILFDAAIAAPQTLSPRWLIYADRAEFRLDHGDVPGAWADFLEARRIAALLRADIVPADQDRIALESGLSRVGAGLVDAGNRLAQQTRDRAFLDETFDAAEQDRLWSLRALTPASNDWRTRLPDTYWDLLARYQSEERALLAQPSTDIERLASGLQRQLQEIEAGAASPFGPEAAQSALAHVRSVLDDQSVLFSFHVAKSSGWLWAVDREGVDAYSIPDPENLPSRVADFVLATRQGDTRAVALGRQLYKDLFGSVSAGYIGHKRWLLELDGPLLDLPFASLVVNLVVNRDTRKYEPVYLVERAALQTIPNALMLAPRAPPVRGEFLGIGDPVYNAADARYTGDRKNRQTIALPRLRATAVELEASSRAWGSAQNKILTGTEAEIATVRTALLANPAVIHFATHVVTAPGDYSSGLIALSLDRFGAMGLMGPTEIVARPVSASLVVMNGCHSGQGDALPGAGLMGLTRAWIAAGARSVLATRWDIPDEAGQAAMVEFYKALRAQPARGPAVALQQAQLTALKEDRLRRDLHPNNNESRSTAAIWAAYFLLGRE